MTVADVPLLLSFAWGVVASAALIVERTRRYRSDMAHLDSLSLWVAERDSIPFAEPVEG